MRLQHIIAVLCSIFSLVGYTQQTNNKHKLLDFELKAEEAFNESEYANALIAYEEYSELGGILSIEMKFKAGVSSLEIHHYKQALTYLEQCSNSPDQLSMSYHYYYAKALQLNEYVDSAKVHYEVYLKYISGDLELSRFEAEIKQEIASCEVAKYMINNPLSINVKLLSSSINSIYDDYSPLVSANEKHLYFTSDRLLTTGNHQFKLDGTYYEDIYISNLVDSQWSVATKVVELDSKDHDACVSLSHDGHQMIIYRYTQTDVFHRASGKLYLSKLETGKWSEPELLPIPVSAKEREVSACFSIDDKEIYFVSDREGGFGGTDIYRTQLLSDGVWSEPINLGEIVNSAFDEDAPFVHPDGKILYFSSRGHSTMGGYDIFKSNITGNHVFSKPINIGYPINTTGDDISFSITSDGKKIYFADNRVGGMGGMDIYTADFHEKTDSSYVIKGKVLSKEKRDPLDVLIKVHITGNEEIISVFSSDPPTGEFVIMLARGEHYTLEIEKDGYASFSVEIDASEMSDFNEVIIDLILEDKN